MPADLLYTAIGMKDYLPVFSSDRSGILSLVMDVPESMVRCPGCKSRDVVRRGTVDRKVHAPPIGLRRTVLSIKTPRVQCEACGSVRTIELPKVVPLKNHTKSFARLALDLRKVMTIADVAIYLGVSETMIRGIDKTSLNRRFGKPKLGHLRYLAIDEISILKGHKYLTIVMDLINGTDFQPFTQNGTSFRPIWGPDGDSLFYASNEDGPTSVYMRPLDGRESTVVVATAPAGFQYWPESWSPRRRHAGADCVQSARVRSKRGHMDVSLR